MRIGKWVPLYNRMLPIPRRMAMSFGLNEGSELYFVPLGNADTDRKFGCEIMISPIPVDSWRSVCRLSVRLHDRPGTLKKATRFLRRNDVNVLLSECCSTYQQRAHWDAICDLKYTPDYERLSKATRDDFGKEMQRILDRWTERFEAFSAELENSDTFIHGAGPAGVFSPLPGLNDAFFVARTKQAESLRYVGGVIEMPAALVRYVSNRYGLMPPNLPRYVMITGNTEQRYMRVFFIKDHSHMFRLVVDDDLKDFSAGGVGVLNQLLEALPSEVNVLWASNYIKERREPTNRGRIDMIGDWDFREEEDSDDVEDKIEPRLRRIVDGIVLRDTEGKEHAGALSVAHCSTAHTMYPRVFVSYSIDYESAKLEQLLRALSDNDYEPVLGTRMEYQAEHIGGRPVAPGVVHSALSLIEGCVAFISFQVKRDDFRIPAAEEGERDRYILPPWAVAEEVFAWSSKHKPFIIRLRDRALEDSRYNPDTRVELFHSDADYPMAVGGVIEALNDFRRGERFATVYAKAQENQAKLRHGPAED
jgi:hypothetical protein